MGDRAGNRSAVLRLVGAWVLLLAVVGSGQFPGLPVRPGRRATGPAGAQRPVPGWQNTPQGGERRASPWQRLLIDDDTPRGTASRTGSGVGLWDALTAMARREENREGEPASWEAGPDRALLLRYGGDVAWRRAGEKGWDLLYWWRKVGRLTAGCQVRQDHRGRSLLVFHDGAYLDCRPGRARVELVRLDREEVQVRVEELTGLFIEAQERALVVALPGGYTVVVKGGMVQVRSRGARRLEVNNLGPEEALVRDPSREIRLAWNEGCSLPCFIGSAPPSPDPLVGPGERAFTAGRGPWRLAWGSGMEMLPREGGWRFQAGPAGGRIQWGRCRFEVPQGASLELIGPKGPSGPPAPRREQGSASPGDGTGAATKGK